MLQQLPALLQGDSCAELCSSCVVLQPNLSQAEGAGDSECQGQYIVGMVNEEKAIVNYLLLSCCTKGCKCNVDLY